MVSVEELKVPAAAQSELRRFQQSFQSGKLRDAVKHLEKAIAIYPQIAAAHQNLGACYVRLGEYDKAAGEFREAWQINPEMIQPPLALAGTDLVLKRYGDAEAAARQALEIDPENTKARYLLAKTLTLQDRDTSETERLLRESFGEFPGAHLALAHLLLNRNERDAAAQQLRDYVEQAQITDRQKDNIHCAIEKLTLPASQSACVLSQGIPMEQD
jgi:tetratricopeptide (TPR) repeat protein